MPLELIPYHKMSVLIIEDLAEMRSSMKSMLGNIGVQHTESVNNGEDALKKLRNNDYDLVFSDYELGRGKDGQQILEEVRFNNLVKPSSVFIMVTAAQTVDMVMGALEFAPDGYIAKPVTLELLKTRLVRIIRTKDIYKEINLALDDDNTEAALNACNRLAMEKPKFALPAYRIKGKILIEQERFEEAKDIYETVLGIKRVAWAILGMAKVHFYFKEYEQAQNLLESLAKTKAKYVEAQDWLAKSLEEQGKYKAAQKVLVEAVAQSPKSIRRQQALGRVAEKNGDIDVMWKSCRKAVALGKNSCFKSPDVFIGLAKSLQPKIKGGSMRDKKLSTVEALNLIESARMDFDLDTIASLKCSLVEAETLMNSGKEEEGKLAYRAADTIISSSKNLSLDDKIDIFNTKLQFETEEIAMEYGKQVLNEIASNKRLQVKYYKTIELFLHNRPADRLKLVKERGEELLLREDVEDALEMYLRASSFKDADEDIFLGALKSIIGRFKKGRPDRQLTQKCDALFKELETLSESDPRHPILEQLKFQWEEITGDE
ncbi:hypothetical protein A9Q99_01270 [Gammaproteobacteria bacterium 45_16_T64]|nr:hypothetical protein A9Q99_01270 [Gammaproteobacteria bacterium 45_16_T64]